MKTKNVTSGTVDRPWRELSGRKSEFQDIVRLLCEFDERTGRFRRFADPQTHYMRKAVASCDPQLLRIFLRELGGFVYHVAVELRCESGSVATSWIHEDGIRAERDTFAGQGEHPVHNITCMTDLFAGTSEFCQQDDALPPGDALRDLMAEHGLAHP